MKNFKNIKKLLILFMFLSSCGFLNKNAELEKETVEAPPVVYINNTDIVIYEPPSSEEEKKCLQEELILEIEQELYEEAIKGVWVTKNQVINFAAQHPRIIASNFLHIKTVQLHSIEGDDLSFIKWLKVEHDEELLVWSDAVYNEAEPHRSFLRYDGSKNIRNIINEQSDYKFQVNLDATVRGKSPKEDTVLKLKLYLSSFYNCQ